MLIMVLMEERVVLLLIIIILVVRKERGRVRLCFSINDVFILFLFVFNF